LRCGGVCGWGDSGFRRAHAAGAPDDLEGVIIDFIDGAEQSLDIAVQEIDSEPIGQVILDARFRYVKMRTSWNTPTCRSRSRRNG
jgi:hypothetical protein